MSDFQHTPGPWHHDKNGNFGNVILGPSGKKLHEADNGFRAVATVQSCCSSNLAAVEDANQTANIALIAAAPDMLDALMKIRQIIVDGAMTGFNCKDGDWAERLFASQGFSADAVKKAIGKLR